MKRLIALLCALCCFAGAARAESPAWTEEAWNQVTDALAWDTVNPVPEKRRILVPWWEAAQAGTSQGDSRTLLFLSSDSPDMESNFGRADAVLVCRVELSTGNVRLLSLPEEGLIDLAELPEPIALRYVNCFGGPSLVIRVLNDKLDLGISRYFAVNVEAFSAIIDRLGGVVMDLTEGEGASLGLGAGRQTLGGEDALRFVRLRRTGDGSLRVRALLESALRQAADNSLSDLLKTASDLLPMTDTSLTTDDLMDLVFALFGQETPGTFDTMGLQAASRGALDEALGEDCRRFLDGKGE